MKYNIGEYQSHGFESVNLNKESFQFFTIAAEGGHAHVKIKYSKIVHVLKIFRL
jgi:hypothetical protein